MAIDDESRSVYIVDDDPDMRDSLRWLLKTVGLRTATFSSAAEFIRGFTGDGPACLVLDVRMPGTSGLDLFEELTAGGVRIPVMFITAYADVPMAVRAMKSGAVEFLEKPFNGQVLLEKVQRAVKRRRRPARARVRPRRGPVEAGKTDRQGARSPGDDPGRAAEQGDRRAPGGHAPGRRAQARQPDAEARRPLAAGPPPLGDRPRDARSKAVESRPDSIEHASNKRSSACHETRHSCPGFDHADCGDRACNPSVLRRSGRRDASLFRKETADRGPWHDRCPYGSA